MIFLSYEGNLMRAPYQRHRTVLVYQIYLSSVVGGDGVSDEVVISYAHDDATLTHSFICVHSHTHTPTHSLTHTHILTHTLTVFFICMYNSK